MARPRRWLLRWLVPVLAAGLLTVSASGKSVTVGGRSINVDVTFTEPSTDPSPLLLGTREVAVVVTQPSNAGPDVYFEYAYSVEAADPGLLSYNRQAGWLGSGAMTWNFQASQRVPSGANWMYVRLNPASGIAQYMSFQIGVPEYSVKFRLPANASGRTIVYFFMQNGEQVGWAQQNPGQGERDYTLAGLTSNNPVFAEQWTGGLADYLLDAEGNGGWVRSGSTVGSVRGNETPVAGSPVAKPITNAPGGAPSPVNPTAPVAPTPAPTPSPTPTAPTPTAPVVGPAAPETPTPSGTGGATKEDVDRLGNRLIVSEHAAVQKAVEIGNAQIVTIDKVGTAVREGAAATIGAADKITAAVVSTGNATVDGVNKAVGVLDAINAQLEAQRAAAAAQAERTGYGLESIEQKLDTANDHLRALSDDVQRAADDRAAVDEDRIEALADAAVSGPAARQDITNAFGAGGSAPSSVSVNVAASAPLFEIALPASMGGGRFDLNPFSDARLGPLLDWFRAAVEWLAYVLLGVWVWQRIGEWSRGLSTVNGAKSNAVSAIPGTGIVGAAAVAAAITAITVPFVVALLSWSFGEFSVGALTSLSFANPVANMPVQALWMLNEMFPVSTLIGALLARLSFAMYAPPLYAGVIAVSRWIIS